MTWEVWMTLEVCGYRSPKVNITPALGISLIVGTCFLLIKTGGL